MIRILFFIAFVAFAVSICFAQQAGIPVAKQYNLSTIKKTVIGKIESFTPAEAAKGVMAGLVLIESNENKITFVLTSTTVIYDSEKSIVGLDKLVKNQKVEVKYHSTSAGINEASVIILLKST